MSDPLAAIAGLEDADEEGRYWLAVTHVGGQVGVISIVEELLPATVPNGAYNTITGDLAEAMGLEGDFTLYDNENLPIERLTAGHFKPASLPDGRTVQFAALHLRASATLGAS